VQLGALELHIPGVKSDRQDRPDRLVFDLDPDEDLPWTEVVAAALLLRQRLDDVGLRSFVKTTGGKGLHVVIPIERRTSWDDVRVFTRGIAEEFAARWPHRFTAVMSKKKRSGRIYLDFLRNAPNATAIAPYSTRARPHAPVATPLAWEELEASRERPWHDIDTVRSRSAGRQPDPWAEMGSVRQTLTRAMIREFVKKD
jgi:bifunctional non-homologous end joining protein LigD